MTIQQPSDPALAAATIVATGEGRVASTELGALRAGESTAFRVYLKDRSPRTVGLAFASTAPGHQPWSTYADVEIDSYDISDSIY